MTSNINSPEESQAVQEAVASIAVVVPGHQEAFSEEADKSWSHRWNLT